jgi:hypothetical protein
MSRPPVLLEGVQWIPRQGSLRGGVALVRIGSEAEGAFFDWAERELVSELRRLP